MADFARVTNLDALRDFKAALQSFGEDATVALSEATSEAQRGLWFIANDCKAHWVRELKKRNEKLQQAKAELFKKQLETSDTRTSAVVERKHVAKWEAAVAQAEQKLLRIKYWATAMEREFMLFKAGVQGLSNIVAGDLPMANARIERMITSLQEYIQLAAPSGQSLKSIAPLDDEVGREAASGSPPTPQTPSSATSQPRAANGESS